MWFLDLLKDVLKDVLVPIIAPAVVAIGVWLYARVWKPELFSRVFPGFIAGFLAALVVFASFYLSASSRARAAISAAKVAETAPGVSLASMPLGTIIASILSAEDFYKMANGSSGFDPEHSRWVLADGSTRINQSALWRITDKDKPPDLRGRFLRGVDTSGERRDPDGQREAGGEVQLDAFQGHTFRFKELVIKGVYNRHAQPNPALGHEEEFISAGEPVQLEEFGTPRFGPETRPANVAVYFYMRIN